MRLLENTLHGQQTLVEHSISRSVHTELRECTSWSHVSGQQTALMTLNVKTLLCLETHGLRSKSSVKLQFHVLVVVHRLQTRKQMLNARRTFTLFIPLCQ